MNKLLHKDFHALDRFNRVLVTGPQRSGTKIVALMIASATNMAYVRRHRHPFMPKYLQQFKSRCGIVLHDPSYVAFLENVQAEDTAIIFVWRSIDEILDSEIRHKWIGRAIEQGYLGIGPDVDPAIEKQRIWEAGLWSTLLNAFTVYYDDLRSHPMFCVDRDGWHINQVDHDGTII